MRTKLCFLFFNILVTAASGQVTLRGTIKNIAPGTRVLAAEVYEPAFDDDVPYAASIAPDGSFRIDLPIDRPTEIFIKAKHSHSVYCKPGTSLTLTWDDSIPDSPVTFEGEDAELNRTIVRYLDELKAFRQKRESYTAGFNRLKNDPMQFKSFVLNNLELDLAFLKEFVNRNRTDEFFRKLQRYNLEYNCAENLMRYRWEKPKNAQLPATYLDFFDRFPVNNPDAMSSPYYAEWYLHEYFLYLQTTFKAQPADDEGLTMPEVAAILLKNVPDLSESDRLKLAAVGKGKFDTVLLATLVRRHQSLLIEQKPPSIPAISYCLAQPAGLLRDLLFAQTMYMMIESGELSLPAAYLDRFRQHVSDPKLREKITGYYERQSAALSNSQPASEAHLHKSGPATNELVLQRLITPYKGNVILVDVWATWCGPCREEMPESNKLREEFAGKPVVFLYLGVESNEKTWKEMIGMLKLQGEHYLLNDTEYKQLSAHFRISGIPHYILVDADGKVVRNNSPRPGSSEIRTLINKLLASRE